MRRVLILLLLASPAAADPTACTDTRAGAVACMAGRLCSCGYARGGGMSGWPDGWRWDFGILRPACGDALPPADLPAGPQALPQLYLQLPPPPPEAAAVALDALTCTSTAASRAGMIGPASGGGRPMSGLRMSAAGVADLALFKGYEARAAGADGLDLKLSGQSGMDARDIMFLRAFTRDQGLMIIFRCPKPSARAFHGTLPAKTFATKAKSNAETGTVHGAQGQLMVSDYDMMSVWRHEGPVFQKIHVSALVPGAARGAWSEIARELVRAMNRCLFSRLQHGCQDDFHSPNNPGVKMTDHFLAVRMGDGIYLPDPIHCENFYSAHALFWPYGAGGRHCGHGPAGASPG